MSIQRVLANDWLRCPDPRTRWRSIQAQAAFVISGAPHQPEEVLARAPANEKAVSTAKAIATSRSATRDIRRVTYAGAETFVPGSAIFGREGYSAVIGAMRAALES